jgi:hypothetical protein
MEDELHKKHRNFAAQRNLAAFLVALAPHTSLQGRSAMGRSSTDLSFSSRPYSNLGRPQNARYQLTSSFHLALLAAYPLSNIYSSPKVIISVHSSTLNVIAQYEVVDFSVMEVELCRTRLHVCGTRRYTGCRASKLGSLAYGTRHRNRVMDKFSIHDDVEISTQRSMQGRPILEVHSRTCKALPTTCLESITTPRKKNQSLT